MLPSIVPFRAGGSQATTLVIAAAVAGLAGAVIAGTESTRAIWDTRLSERAGFAAADPLQAGPLPSATGAPGLFAAIALVFLVVLTVHRLERRTVPALACGLALAFGGVFWSHAAIGHPALYVGLWAIATLAGFAGWLAADRPRPGLLAVGTVSYAILVALYPPAAVALPVFWATGWLRSAERSAELQFRATGPALGIVSTIAAVAGLAMAFSPGGEGWPFALRYSAAPEVGGRLSAELGVLGAGVFAAGLWAVGARWPRLLGMLAGWLVAMAAAAMVSGPSGRWSAILASLPVAWVIAGAGMAWLLQHGGRATAAALLIVLLVPVLNLAANYDVGAGSRAMARLLDRYVSRLDDVLPQAPVVLAEGRVVDGIVRTGTGPLPDRWSRAPQDPAAVRALWESGVPVLGFASARANLRELGLRFAPVGAGVPMTLDELVGTVPAGWMVIAATGTQFSRGVPVRTGPTFADLGGTVELLGASRARYVVAGVKGLGHRALERVELKGRRVRLDIAPGDPVGLFRAPVAIRARSGPAGARIDVDGHPVASSRTGIALVVMAPDGSVAGAYGPEFDRDVRIEVAPAIGSAALVNGTEPCTEVGMDDWTDVSRQAGRASLAALLDPDDRLIAYLGSSRLLDVRQKWLRHGHLPEIAVEIFRPFKPESRDTLGAALHEDGLAASSTLTGLPWVYRVRIDSPGRRSQMALRLGGFAEVGYARLVRAPEGRTLTTCSAMRGGPGLFAGRQQIDRADLDLADDDLFVYGWDRVERAGEGRFRWTRVSRAEWLLPLSRGGPFVLELDVASAASAAELSLRVNDTLLSPVQVTHRPARHRWALPAGALHPGLNRVWLGVSDLVRPSDLGESDDDRQLGVAMFGIALTRPPEPREKRVAGGGG